MKTLDEYIFEELNKYPLWCEIALTMFKGSKNLTKDAIADMVDTFCDVEGRLKKFSDYLASLNSKEYMPYQPNDDEFIQKENRNKVVNQISEYILKCIVK